MYYKYSTYLKEKYNEKVYKIPINLPLTCPNVEKGCGCIYCSEIGAGFEALNSSLPVKEQLSQNIEYISKRYNAYKYIAYFQNYTNTYLPLKDFEKYINDAVYENVVEISVSTRPDCVTYEYLEVLKKVKETYNINITIELGLQTVNYKTLTKINRGHTLGEFIDAYMLIKSYGFSVCVHVIANLPWDNMEDVIETAKVLSALNVDCVKIHSLYILKNTVLGQMYTNNEFSVCTVEQYKNRVITFLSYLKPTIKVERLLGRAPKEDTLFSNWGISWWKIKDEIELYMTENNIAQGDNYNYLNGKAFKNKNFF